MDEQAVLGWIHGASPLLDIPMEALTYATTCAAIWFILAFILTCMPRWRKAGVAIVVVIVVTYLLVDCLMKGMVGRPRPFEVMDVDLIVGAASGSSFPSGHTASSFAASTVLFYYNRRWGIPAFVFSALVGVSRMYLYMHWPTDVLVGAIVGVMIAILSLWFLYRYIPFFRDEND